MTVPERANEIQSRDHLHDSIALALDAISVPGCSHRNLAEARTYLRDALRQIGGAA
ncbi:hypothetical protein [Salipiger mucosus]|uniref:Uncharacterized protein n=1 Tax=Salipiger mucosus DSM 16094 TaxID=1123237 RepID=S9QVE4_9RHOB|nr:hypothetical protein [Salipiger mucosus]EPX85391.1 hypothetical protein Salmuc_02771 [Salipiger mucosus DSM 16094]